LADAPRLPRHHGAPAAAIDGGKEEAAACYSRIKRYRDCCRRGGDICGTSRFDVIAGRGLIRSTGLETFKRGWQPGACCGYHVGQAENCGSVHAVCAGGVGSASPVFRPDTCGISCGGGNGGGAEDCLDAASPSSSHFICGWWCSRGNSVGTSDGGRAALASNGHFTFSVWRSRGDGGGGRGGVHATKPITGNHYFGA